MWPAVALPIIGCCGYGVIIAISLRGSRPVNVKVPFGAEGPVDEQLAIRTTRAALYAVGIRADGFQPVPFHEPPAVFARNDRFSNEGYVLWREPRSTKHWDYFVRCKWHTSFAACGVSRGE